VRAVPGAALIIDLAAWRAEQTPGRPALRWRGEWLDYAELDRRAMQLAARLHAEGVRRGDRVAILAHNHVAHLDLVLAAPKLGFIYTPLNFRLAAAEQRDLVAAIDPKLVLHDRAHELKAESLELRRLPLSRYASWLGKSVEPLPAPELSPEDTHMILFTGGSTGVPKGAQIPYRQTLGNAAATVSAWGITADDCAIQATPAFHAALNVLTLPLLYAGGRVDWMEQFEPGDYLERAADATLLFMVPTMFQALADHPAFASAKLPRVRYAITGGAPCPPALCERFAARGVRFRLGFGMTECGVNCFTITDEEAARHPDSVGRPLPGLQAVIRTAEGRQAAPGEVGELTLSGPMVFSGYFRRPAETADALRNGWLWTGDLARQDRAGLFYICGRRKEMFISGGENVYPAEVEAALAQCQGVLECAVVGIPHARWGEAGLAAVILRRGARQTVENLREELKTRLAGYKVPAEFMVLKTLPKTGAGKINKPGIRALFDRQGPPA
jgi:fatty-acyl-CoA synthase